MEELSPLQELNSISRALLRHGSVEVQESVTTHLQNVANDLRAKHADVLAQMSVKDLLEAKAQELTQELLLLWEKADIQSDFGHAIQILTQHFLSGNIGTLSINELSKRTGMTRARLDRYFKVLAENLTTKNSKFEIKKSFRIEGIELRLRDPDASSE